MTKKMGKYNSITSERFHTIKGALAEGMGEEAIKNRYKIKQTMLNYIKMCKTYYEYYLRTEGIPAARKMPEVMLPNCKLKLIDVTPRTIDAWKKKQRDPRIKSENECRCCELLAVVNLTLKAALIAIVLGISIGILITLSKG